MSLLLNESARLAYLPQASRPCVKHATYKYVAQGCFWAWCFFDCVLARGEMRFAHTLKKFNSSPRWKVECSLPFPPFFRGYVKLRGGYPSKIKALILLLSPKTNIARLSTGWCKNHLPVIYFSMTKKNQWKIFGKIRDMILGMILLPPFSGFSFLSSKFFVCGCYKKCVPSSVETDGRFPTAEQCGAVQKAAAEEGIVQQKASALLGCPRGLVNG